MDLQVINNLKNGKVGVMPTDTIYGIVGSALNPKTVEEIYKLRKRSSDKPFIILISSMDDLKKFGISLTAKQKDFLQKNWPNPLSVVLPVSDDSWEYLHRGTKSLAFRMPKNERLLETLGITGPLVAPSANFEGKKPAETIEDARKYFGNKIDFYCEAARFSYVDEGKIKSQPSTLIELLENGEFKILRQGSFDLLISYQTITAD